MGKDVIIACDFASKDECLSFLDKFGDKKVYAKIGMELYYAAGPDIVREIKSRGHSIFLDLKLHDIPNTVRKAMSVLKNLDVDMVNVHAGGGVDMMKAALEGLTRPDGTRAKLIAVTMLTSISRETMNSQLLIPGEVENTVLTYAANAKAAGLDGIVCSPLESPAVHEKTGGEFITVTPGVRYPTDSIGDQSRVTTPQRANELGSDYIVVGRPITAASDPVAAYDSFKKDFCGG